MSFDETRIDTRQVETIGLILLRVHDQILVDDLFTTLQRYD